MRRDKQVAASWILLPVLLLGAALRLVGIYNVSPPGLEHDEVANWLIDRAILEGQHAVYFTEAYGHEAGFHYVQAGFVGLLGDHALALRLPAAFLGLLGIAVTFALARQLFGRRVAFISAGLLAALFYPVFYSRLGLRAIMLPVFSGLAAAFWWRGWGVETGDRRLGIGDWRLWKERARQPAASSDEARLASRTMGHNAHATRYLALAGVFAGLSLHTYMAARTVPVFFALFVVALAIIRPATVRARWRQLVVFWLFFALVASPLVIYLLANPGAEFRISEIDAPLQALRQGNIAAVVDNSVDILGAFGFAGDPLWRQNVPPMPVFDPLVAVFFYLCLAASLAYVSDVRHLFLILWILTAAIPSIVTIDAPSSIRIINIMPVLTILPAIVMHNLGHLSTETGWLSTAPVDKWGPFLFFAGLIIFNTARTTRAIFVTWPANDEVRFVWQEALTDAATYLDGASYVEDVAVGGWTPDSMDPPTMALTLRREDLQLRFFDPQQALLIPASGGGAPAQVLHPTILPLAPGLRAPLQSTGVFSATEGSFIRYAILQTPQPAPQHALDVTFADEIAFLGYSSTPSCLHPGGNATCEIVAFWRVLRTPPAERHFFLHILNAEGVLLSTADALGAPSPYWRRGDILLQQHSIAVEHLSEYDTMRIGVYNPHSGQRLTTGTGEAFVALQPDTDD